MMAAKDSRSEMSVFLAALDHETRAAREACVDAECAGDAELRAAVDELLEAHDRPGNILDRSLAVPCAGGDRWAADKGDHQIGGPTDPRLAGPASPAEQPGAVIGPFKLLEQIGEGGFGLVYVAEQTVPVKRRVALKIVKPGMDTREVIARFEAERQALAMMDHPHIARVFDAGTTATGRPYFVMELVRGIAITEFCDRARLSTNERLELFVTVCQAVQHAHQKGIIHRDVKPSNVLSSLCDGRPVVKVIDFGVAKAIGAALTDKTLYTRFAQVIGTPLYMSPEQIELSGVDVDTRSDIYSLGVLLYELLTGTTPFDRQRLAAASFDEIRRIIREEEPPRPSTRLTAQGKALSTVLENRRIDSRDLSTALRGDLDWIVMKALDKVRSRRYETAAAFAGDIQRFLRSEPVEARPPSSWYRFQRLARRNRVALTSTALVAAALVLGTVVSTWQAVRARAAQTEADELRYAAVKFADHLREATVLLDSARAHTDEQRWSEAHEQYDEAARLLPGHYLVWAGRGSLSLRLGLWDEAAADFSLALELGAPTNNPGWWGVPQLLLFAGDDAGSQAVALRMWREVENSTDKGLATLAIRSCLLTELPLVDLQILEERARRLAADQTTESIASPARAEGVSSPPELVRFFGQPGGPPRGFGVPPFVSSYSLGLVHYRGGACEQAIEELRRSLEQAKQWRFGPMRAVPIATPVLAMALYRTGRIEEAAQALADADRVLFERTQEMLDGGGGATPIPWFDWVEFQILHREATKLLTGRPAIEDPRMRAIKSRARAALRIQ